MKNTHIVIGKQCVLQLLSTCPERVKRIFVARGQMPPELNACTIPVKETSKDFLSDLAQNPHHQGIAAEVKDRLFLSVKEAAASTGLVLALDSIEDPQNLGALFRASECFGILGLMWSKNRGADLSCAVAKVSVGASEIVPMIRVSNLAEGLKAFQREGWTIAAADAGDRSISLYDFTFPEKCVLVMGSEGKGARPLIRKIADITLAIPMRGVIDSLNVSQAAACFLSQWASPKP